MPDFELSEKQQLSRNDDRHGAVVHLSVSAVIFAVFCVLVTVVAVGLLTWYLPDRTCQDESQPTGDSTEIPTAPSTTRDPNIIWDSPRLPDTLVPLHYDLEMKTDLDKFTFDGRISITLLCNRETKLLVLNSNKLEILRETARIEESFGGNSPDVLLVTVDATNQYINVVLDGNLKVNTEYNFTVWFRGYLNTNLKGFYRSSYTAPDGTKRWLAVTFFSPTNARMAFPCFDDPGLKANLTLTMIHSRNYTALGNMPAEGVVNGSDGLATTRFATSPKIATYLVCFAVLDFPCTEITSRNNITIRGWARPDAMDSLQFGLNMTADSLDFYIEHIGVDFPLPKIDVVAVPDFEAGAMENWGLITYRETALLNKATTTSESRTGSQGFTIAHEMGHQYFGNLVTHQWWEYILLKEGGATYLAYTSLPVVQPTWDYQDMFALLNVNRAMSTDALSNARPVQKDAATPAEIAASFDGAITYNKGPVILRMCENIIGKPSFKKGLTTYMKRYSFSTATNDDFWICMQEAVDANNTMMINVSDVMHTWVLQAGFPLVSITRTYGNVGGIPFKAEQRRFMINGNDDVKEDNSKWMIPLWFRTQTLLTNNEPMWMNNQTGIEHQISGSDTDWLLVNPDRFGYYRVNYDLTNWQLLADQLKTNHSVFSPVSRATLIDDSFELARAGKISYSIPLDITRYLEKETDYVPWKASIAALSYLNRLLVTEPAYGSFTKHMRNQITSLYQSLGRGEGGSHLEIMTRDIALSTACAYELPECQEMSLDLFRQWMANETNNTIPINQKATVYCTAIAAGGAEEFEFALRYYQETPDAAERSIILNALPCTRLVWALNNLLHLTLDSAETIRAQDAPTTIANVARNPISTLMAWNFFREKYNDFRSRFGDSLFQFREIVTGVTKPFTTEFQLQELEKFMADNLDQGTGASAFAQAVEEIKTNIAWLKTHYQDVKMWLDQAVAPPPPPPPLPPPPPPLPHPPGYAAMVPEHFEGEV